MSNNEILKFKFDLGLCLTNYCYIYIHMDSCIAYIHTSCVTLGKVGQHDKKMEG